jgi:PAS domain S-box-containing protein
MTRTTPTRARPLIAALILAALVIAFAALSFSRKATSFQPLGFSADDKGAYWQVTAVEHEDSGLLVGDQILLINGQEFGQLADPTGSLRQRISSELVVLRGEQMARVAYELPSLAVDLPYLILALIGIAYLLIGIYTLLRDQRRPSFLFYLWCLASAVLYIASPAPPYDLSGRAIYLLDEVARILLAPLTLHLFLVFPRPLIRKEKLSRLIPFLYLPSAFLLALQADLIFANGRWLLGGRIETALGILDQLELYHLVLFSFVAVAVLVWRLRSISQPEPHRQATWIAVGMAAGYLPFFGLYVLPLTLGAQFPTALTSLAVLPLALVPLTFAYAILRYKLWDIGAIVRDTVSLSVTILVGVIGFSLANMLVTRVVPTELNVARTLASFLSGLVIAGLLVPTRRGVSSSLDRFQHRTTWSKRRALGRFGQQMLEERSLARLCSSLLDQLELALELDHATLFLASGDRLLPYRPQKGLPPDLSFEDFDADFWGIESEALSGVEFPTDELTTKQRLFTAGYRYAFPLRVRDHHIGIFLTGYKQSDLPLSSDDLELIRSVLNQAALAIENAQLLEQVSSQLDEVDRLQRYTRQIIESSPAGIAVVDGNGELHSINQAFGSLVGLQTGEVAGRKLRDLLPLESLPSPGDGIREVRFQDPQGEERYLQISMAPLEEGPDDQRVLIVQDVSQRVAMENALKEKERLASLGMLAAGVAHEVNTPITGISSYAQMLLSETPDDDPRRLLLEKVEKQTFRAARIVNSLLDFARDRQHAEVPVSLRPLIGESLELLKERLLESDTLLEWNAPDEEILVLGHEGELQQVFTNLVINALDAMAQTDEQGKLQVELDLRDKWIVVSVEDNGPGIASEELDKIFQPFYSTKLAEGGTGLGLSISYNIVRRHGGELRVVSHRGEGSRFIVELPRLESRPEQTS